MVDQRRPRVARELVPLIHETLRHGAPPIYMSDEVRWGEWHSKICVTGQLRIRNDGGGQAPEV
eukprot:25114-Eustigmatos_ZCMA.PRE.1